ncbi:hypothetical protein P154DRAFT_538633 [Amniculicola lignicola CBS 123094]|uniref:Uncharacterized protein n=1 Tax=Amniculicola lignicola CBS 123094 TaxID=1392246 RepID=A0A6A5W3V4_9PLEO|nr:hypothetical protein P154DRAFT_538633 [Amniculicola lignicola CBS 123094]
MGECEGGAERHWHGIAWVAEDGFSHCTILDGPRQPSPTAQPERGGAGGGGVCWLSREYVVCAADDRFRFNDTRAANDGARARTSGSSQTRREVIGACLTRAGGSWMSNNWVGAYGDGWVVWMNRLRNRARSERVINGEGRLGGLSVWELPDRRWGWVLWGGTIWVRALGGGGHVEGWSA